MTTHTAMGAATDIKMREMSVEEKMIRKLKVSPPQVRPEFSGLFAPPWCRLARTSGYWLRNRRFLVEEASVSK